MVRKEAPTESAAATGAATGAATASEGLRSLFTGPGGGALGNSTGGLRRLDVSSGDRKPLEGFPSQDGRPGSALTGDGGEWGCR